MIWLRRASRVANLTRRLAAFVEDLRTQGIEALHGCLLPKDRNELDLLASVMRRHGAPEHEWRFSWVLVRDSVVLSDQDVTRARCEVRIGGAYRTFTARRVNGSSSITHGEQALDPIAPGGCDRLEWPRHARGTLVTLAADPFRISRAMVRLGPAPSRGASRDSRVRLLSYLGLPREAASRGLHVEAYECSFRRPEFDEQCVARLSYPGELLRVGLCTSDHTSAGFQITDLQSGSVHDRLRTHVRDHLRFIRE